MRWGICAFGHGAALQSHRSCVQADKGDPVAIYAQDKENALAIGVMLMSTQEVRSVNKGHGVESLHYLTDGLWRTQKLV
jgi:predicted RNA-binding protein (TIGR00451 family)